MHARDAIGGCARARRDRRARSSAQLAACMSYYGVHETYTSMTYDTHVEYRMC